MVGSVVMWWTGMVYLREWKRVCGCGFGSGSGSNHAIEEVVTYRVGLVREVGSRLFVSVMDGYWRCSR
jgi:hypothetical protein